MFNSAMRKKIVILGSGGHAKIIADLIMDEVGYELVGFIDTNKINYRNIDTIGDDACLDFIIASGVKYAFIGIGAIANNTLRMKLFDNLKTLGFSLPNLIHPSSVIGYGVKLGEGNFIGPNVVINSHATLGDNCIVNSGSIIEHNVILGNHSHLAPRVTVCGSAVIANNCFIGVGTTVLENCNIHSNSIVGAMSLVNKNIVKDSQIGFGIPFKVRSCNE